MQPCLSCQRTNPDGVFACVFCGSLMPPEQDPDRDVVQTHMVHVDEDSVFLPRWGSAYFDRNSHLFLYVAESNQTVEVNVHKSCGVVLGRLTSGADQAPEVNLTPFGAVDAGVSRQHAHLCLMNYSLYITDLDSANATYLNGRRLRSYESRIVRDGDEICLGALKMQVFFTDNVDAIEREGQAEVARAVFRKAPEAV